jgi:hypothetical protein
MTTALLLAVATEMNTLFSSHRVDLRLNAAIVIVVAVALLAWLWRPARQPRPVET